MIIKYLCKYWKTSHAIKSTFYFLNLAYDHYLTKIVYIIIRYHKTQKNWKFKDHSGHCIIVVQLIIVLQHLSLYLGWIHPCNEVFHIPCYKECWVSNRLWTHSQMSLLNVCDSFFQVLTKLQPHQNSCKPTSTRINTQNKYQLCKPMKGDGG